MLLLRWKEDPFSEKDTEFDFRNSECEVKIVRLEFQKPSRLTMVWIFIGGGLFMNY